ncbi:Uncharacterised protein [Mycobacterium tuberculosis]|nr:Uncharacterised protein [Mycobacterium tuberculosis]
MTDCGDCLAMFGCGRTAGVKPDQHLNRAQRARPQRLGRGRCAGADLV